MMAPSAHPRAAEGGVYSSGPTELIPFRRNEIADKLNGAPDPGECTPLTPGELDDNAKRFCETYTDDREPNALDPILRNFDPTPGGRHASMFDTLCWGLEEGKAGRFPAQRAVDELRERWQAAIGGDCRNDDPDEFDRMVRDAVMRADDKSAEELWDRAHRDVWPTPMKPQRVAMQVMDRARAEQRPLAFWRGDWYVWGGRCWQQTSDAEMRRYLYYTLRQATYTKVDKGVTVYLHWDPDKPKIDKVVDALKAEVLLPGDRAEDSWADGRNEPEIPFANGLLRLTDRKLLPHTPDYFNTECLPFDYDPSAKLDAGGSFCRT